MLREKTCPRFHTTTQDLIRVLLDQSEATEPLHSTYCVVIVGSGGRAVEHRTVNRGDSGSIPPTAVSKLEQFHSPHIYLCLSEETLKASGPFYLVSKPWEVKDPTQGVNV